MRIMFKCVIVFHGIAFYNAYIGFVYCWNICAKKSPLNFVSLFVWYCCQSYIDVQDGEHAHICAIVKWHILCVRVIPCCPDIFLIFFYVVSVIIVYYWIFLWTVWRFIASYMLHCFWANVDICNTFIHHCHFSLSCFFYFLVSLSGVFKNFSWVFRLLPTCK